MVTYQQLIDYCLTKIGTAHDYKEEWQADRVQVANKMFALLSTLHDRPIISLKCDLIHAEQLREQYKEIVPGYYLNKAHWNTLYIDGDIPDQLFFDCIDESYALVVKGLTKKIQGMLAAGEC